MPLFRQTSMLPDGRVIMKITGKLVEMLVELDPHTYKDYVKIVNGVKVLHVEMLKALYGMLKASLLFYKKLRADLESIGFEVNPYNPCVANRMVDGLQHTVSWHVDDLTVKSSHVNPKLPSINDVKAVRGKRHNYLGMVLDFSTPGVVKVDMTEYVESMIKEFPEELTVNAQNSKQPWNQDLFDVDPESASLANDVASVG